MLACGHSPVPRRGSRILFPKNNCVPGQGCATVSLSLADALSVPGNGHGRAPWLELLLEYCDEINIVPDLDQRIGSAEWLRGVLTFGALCASALYLFQGFAPIPGLSHPAFTDRPLDDARALMITPRALLGDRGAPLAATDPLPPRPETPATHPIII